MKHQALRALKVMVVGGNSPSTQLVRMALNLSGISDITIIADSVRALELLRHDYFDVIYCDSQADRVDELPFPQAARKAEGMRNAMAPIFVVYARARRREVERSRDDGVTDVLTTPITAKTLVRKLQAAFANPRPFIKAPDFFGPDRRSSERQDSFDGKDRRARTPRKVKVNAAGHIKAAPEKPQSEDVLI